MILEIGKKGFSLMELSLVGLTIGLIASIGWPQLKKMTHHMETQYKEESVSLYLTQLKERAILTGKAQNAILDGQKQGTFFPDGTSSGFHSGAIHVSENGRIQANDQQ